MIDKTRKLELLRRSLGIKHKLKVQDSVKAPDNHEEIAQMLLSRWELEDEMRAIEVILNEARDSSVNEKKKIILKSIDSDEAITESAKKRKSKGI